MLSAVLLKKQYHFMIFLKINIIILKSFIKYDLEERMGNVQKTKIIE